MEHPLLRFAVFELTILLPLVAGYAWRRRMAPGPDLARRVFWISLIGFETPIYMALGWGMKFQPGHLKLPLIGLVISVAGLLALYMLGRRWGYDRPSLGTLAATGALSNQGYFLGGYLCFLLAGETGLALSVVFILYWNVTVYGLLFPIARWASGESEHLSFAPVSAIWQLVTDLRAIPLPGFLLGLLLNRLDVARPEVVANYLQVAPPLSILVVLFGVGLSIEASELCAHSRMVWAASATKFILMPSIAVAMAFGMGLEGNDLLVVVIESACPAAIFSVVISTLFNLNPRLAAALLVWTTAIFLVAVCPVLVLVFG